MIGGIEETSASFEARTAPRSYPTDPVIQRPAFADRKLWNVRTRLLCLNVGGADHFVPLLGFYND